MQNNIDKIISNALSVNKEELTSDIKNIFNELKDAINMNRDLIIEANNIDLEKGNGIPIDFEVINNIFNNILDENIFFGDVVLMEKNDDDKIIYGKQVMDTGNVLVVNDGNPFVIFELAIRNIIAGNTSIFLNDGYMYATNKVLIGIIQSIFERKKLSKYFVQLYIDNDYNDALKNFANIDLVICVGSHEEQLNILKNSKVKTIVSGYENFDIYIEDTNNIEFINKINSLGLNIQYYVRNDVDIQLPNSIIVDDIDEAIAQINYNGSRFSTSIFTDSRENAIKFIRDIKSKTVTVNTSPTIERIMDIKQTDLTIEKTIVYPMEFKVIK